MSNEKIPEHLNEDFVGVEHPTKLDLNVDMADPQAEEWLVKDDYDLTAEQKQKYSWLYHWNPIVRIGRCIQYAAKVRQEERKRIEQECADDKLSLVRTDYLEELQEDQEQLDAAKEEVEELKRKVAEALTNEWGANWTTGQNPSHTTAMMLDKLTISPDLLEEPTNE